MIKPATAPGEIKSLTLRLPKIAFLGIATVASVSGYLAGSIYFYGNQKTTAKADAAIVLGAAVWGEEPSPVFRERINHAINLYHSQQVENIIFTGGQGEITERAESIVAKDYAIARGVPEANILAETRSHTTFQNLYYAKQEADKQKLTKFIIVSDPLHLKRAIVMARDIGMNAQPYPTPTTRYKTLNSQLPFLARETYFYGQYLLARVLVSPVENSSKF